MKQTWKQRWENNSIVFLVFTLIPLVYGGVYYFEIRPLKEKIEVLKDNVKDSERKQYDLSIELEKCNQIKKGSATAVIQNKNQQEAKQGGTINNNGITNIGDKSNEK